MIACKYIAPALALNIISIHPTYGFGVCDIYVNSIIMDEGALVYKSNLIHD